MHSHAAAEFDVVWWTADSNVGDLLVPGCGTVGGFECLHVHIAEWGYKLPYGHVHL